jgi:hypothetical protein
VSIAKRKKQRQSELAPVLQFPRFERRVRQQEILAIQVRAAQEVIKQREAELPAPVRRAVDELLGLIRRLL